MLPTDWKVKNNREINSGPVKTDGEIELLKIGGKICAQVLKKVIKTAGPAVACLDLNEIARKEIQKRGAVPSFMTVEGYHWAICTTLNEQVVHGIPTNRELKIGDILGIDIGVRYGGFHTDMATTIGIGQISPAVHQFLKTGQETLAAAILAARVGAKIGDISATIGEMIKKAGYSVVKSLTGHGVGRELHEEPLVPGYGRPGTGPQILKNMVLAIEVIYSQGSGEVCLEKDGWTIATSDGSLAALFEQTVMVTNHGPIVLTPYL